MPLIACSLHADCPQIAWIFYYGAFSPAFDADYMTEDIGNSDDYVSKAMSEVASMLSTSAGKQASVGVPNTNYAFESLSMDHFLKGIEYLAIKWNAVSTFD